MGDRGDARSLCRFPSIFPIGRWLRAQVDRGITNRWRIRTWAKLRPRDADDLTDAELAAAAIDIDRVLEREPELGDFGFGVWNPRRKTSEERTAELRSDRESIRELRSLAQFMAARGWLRQFSKIKTFNPRGSSYGLKHGG